MSLHCQFQVFAVLIFGAFASAATTARAEPPAQSDTASYQFEDEIVRGDASAPTLEVLQVRTRKARTSLVRVREHFLRELFKSVENQ